ncbi:MAG: RNA 3'-terminal phosphate cyclase [Candidatus Thorarchaeota archaeon]|nr:RNA 3'-terminal phosphate cyclase [Candidatus Thorarchaeota archaeon]
MIEIDGSFGEGGGQILRTAVGLSALTMKPIRITRIRAGRPQPGLKKQHLAGVELVGHLVNADIHGLEVGSQEITFIPRERRGGRLSYDVGSAGSISLVLQAVLPPAVVSQERVQLDLRGGTDVAWSPPVDYMRNVFSFVIAKMGPTIEIEQMQRGHYPKGGGRVRCSVSPVETLATLDAVDFGTVKQVHGVSHCVRLPSHIAKRQSASCESLLKEKGLREVQIREETYPVDRDPHLGPGSGIVLWADSDSGNRIGADSLGAREKSAEEVGKEAAMRLLNALSTGRAVDPFLADMLVPYLGMAQGRSCIGVCEVTSHLLTNVWAAERIIGASIRLEGALGEQGVLTVEGSALRTH